MTCWVCGLARPVRHLGRHCRRHFRQQGAGRTGWREPGRTTGGNCYGVLWAAAGGVVIYGILKAALGLRLSREEEYDGADLSIHKISATPGSGSELVANSYP